MISEAARPGMEDVPLENEYIWGVSIFIEVHDFAKFHEIHEIC